MKRLLLGAALAVLLAPLAASQPWTSHRPDGHAPIGVMGDHTHDAQEVMVSLRSMWMPMSGSRLGTDAIADADVVAPEGQNFLVTPTEMPMRMDMLGVMYAPVRRVTFMAMLPLVTMDMDHRSRMSIATDPEAIAFSTSSSGLGDVSATAFVLLAETGRSRAHVGLGASFPTGSVDQTDDTPMGEDQLLPYPMQTGSGTVDFQPSLTYLGQSDRFGWGAQARGTVRLGENDRSYALGNRAGLTGWASVLLTDAFSLSTRLDGQAWDNVTVADGLEAGEAGFPYGMGVANRLVPTVFPDLRAGERVDLSVGLNAMVPSGALDGLRAAVEVGVPVYQRLAGPQLETDLVLTVGAQYAFHL
ncbi:MAG: transporter [Bacteroidota bacterium]